MQKILPKKMLTLALGFFISTTMLSGCSKNTAETKQAEPQKTQGEGETTANSKTTNTTTQTAKTDSASNKTNTPASNIANLFARNAKSAIYIVIGTTNNMTEKQKSCLFDLKTDDIAQQIQPIYEANFTKEELAKFDAINQDPNVKATYALSEQMLKKSIGLPVDESVKASADNQKAMKTLQQFAQSDLGKKFSNFKKADDIISKAMDKKISSCGIKLDL